MVIEERMLGNRSLRRPRSGTLDTLILEDGMHTVCNEDIKRETNLKRMIQGLQLPMEEHLRENIELIVTHFEPVSTLFAVPGDRPR